MNKRIQELIEQATTKREFYPAGCNGYPEYRYDFDQEKFAELIVREYINEIEGLQVLQSTLDWSQHWNRAIAHTALHLKEHFGVEE